MPDREKVIKGLEIHLKPNSRCTGCPYPNNGLCGDQLYHDALALLKAQEPVLAVKLQSKKYIGRTGIAYDGSCGNCSTYLMRAWRACPLCGQAVKWE